MKNIKRVLALVIAVVMIAGTFASVSAATPTWYNEAVTWMENQGVAIIGSNAGKKITRNEFVLWVAKIDSAQLSDEAWNEVVPGMTFTDVNENHHYAAIAYSQMMGYIVGNGDGTFAPDKTISLAEACAVIVRLLNWEHKVNDTSAENWKYNYIQVANRFCKVLDSTFLANTDTYNYDYELSYGEAAYLLALVLNYKVAGQVKTSEGIDLGERVKNATGGSIGKTYYVTQLDRVTYKTGITGDSKPLFAGNANAGVDWFGKVDANGDPVFEPRYKWNTVDARYTAEFDTAKDVVLVNIYDSTDVVKVKGADLVKLLGLDAKKSEDLKAVYTKLNAGTIVNVVLNKADNKVTRISAPANSVTVDTVLQAANYKVGEVNNRFIGWAVAGTKDSDNDWATVLPSTYNSDKVTSWTNVKKNANGVATEATLNFMGKEYKVGGNGTFKVYSLIGGVMTELTVNEAVKTVINAAQGEMVATFNDIDQDGSYDNVVVTDSYAFEYAVKPEIVLATTGAKYEYMSSVSDGVVLGEKVGKQFPMGAVLINKTAKNPNTNKTIDTCSDAFTFDSTPTGTLSLVLVASNAHYAMDAGSRGTGDNLPYYQQITLAEFGVGVIEKIDPIALDGYWVATIRKTDGSYDVVYIPTTASDRTTLPVSLGGATADYTFDCSTWLTFLTDTVKNGCINAGIVSAVDQISDPAYKAAVGAWMVGHYVQYAFDPQHQAIAMISTDSQTSTSGFVTGVTKTSTGDNTYNVTIAKSANGSVSDTPYYLTAAIDAASGEYRYTTPVTKATSKDVGPTVGKLHVLNVNGTWYFQYTITNSTTDTNNYGKYGYNCNGTTAGQMAQNGSNWVYSSVGFINEALNSEIYTDSRYDGKAWKPAAWTVDADGIVHDQTGKAVVFQYLTVGRCGVAGTTTVEVRASVSSMFDWANYNIYNALFQGGKLINPNAGANGKINPGQDLIYVTLCKDSNTNYIVAGDKVTWPATAASYAKEYYSCLTGTTAANAPYLCASRISQNTAPTAAWMQVDGEYELTSKEVGTRVPTTDVYGVVNGYTTTFDKTVGYGPYYERTKTEDGYTYVVRFTKVVTYEGVAAKVSYAIDPATTTMFALIESGSNKQVVDTTGSYRKDASYGKVNGYYVDEAGLVYVLYKIGYVADGKGASVDFAYANCANTATENNVTFTSLNAPKYATLTVKEAPTTTPGWYPGLLSVTLDGTDYIATKQTEIVIVTPSSAGFDITTTTLDKVPDNGLFVTTWNAAEEYGVLKGIAVVGEAATTTQTSGTNPVDVTPAGITLKNGEQLVYLSKNAKPVVHSGLYGKTWNVESDESAYAVLTGKDIGSIYRAYSTYEAAKKASEIDLVIVGGHWYKVDINGAIIADMTEVVYSVQANTLNADQLNGLTKVYGSKTIATLTTDIYDVAGAENKDVVYIAALDVVANNKTDSEKAAVTAYNNAVVAAATATEAYNTAVADENADADNVAALKTAMDSAVAALNTAIDALTTAETRTEYGRKLVTLGTAVYEVVTTTTEATDEAPATTTYSVNALTVLVPAGVYEVVKNADDTFTVYDLDEANRRIEVSATLKGVQTGVITDTTVAGKTTATIDGKKNVDVSDYKFEFYYLNGDETALLKAGDSTSVNVTSAEGYKTAYASQQKAYNDAKAAYDKAVAEGVATASKLDELKEAMDTAYATLIAKKNELAEKHFNGQFWNVPNSPYYKYVVLGQNFQQSVSTLTFNYIKVNGVYCVFADQFAF